MTALTSAPGNTEQESSLLAGNLKYFSVSVWPSARSPAFPHLFRQDTFEMQVLGKVRDVSF